MSRETQVMAQSRFTADADASKFEFSPEVVMLAAPNGAQGEAIRTLRTYIVGQHLEKGRRGLAVCAPTRGVGATYIAVNLAVALAQVGMSTLLIDGDMRHPSMESFIKPCGPALGLRQWLEGDGEGNISNAIQSDVIENLSVMFSGGATASAQELLSKERFAEGMERCLRDYDVTVVDTPPANSCADARRISTIIGYSILVAQRHVSLISDVKTLAQQLDDDNAKLVGTVMREV
jgi:capsular exopolysaccharide synthesis family protein